MIEAARLAEINVAATRIRSEVPIAGDTATEAECVARHQLVWDELTRYGLWSPHPDQPDLTLSSRRWRPVLLDDLRVVGKWAHSDSEAALWCAVWWNGDVLDADEALQADGTVTLW